MTETSAPEDQDPIRQHPEDPAEGPDEDEAEVAQPREHPEEPAEG